MTGDTGDREQFQRAREVFLKALEHEPGRRDRVLDDLCRGDARLRAEVDSLLANVGADTDHLMPKADGSMPHADVERRLTSWLGRSGERHHEGQRLAERYVLEERIGEGGMGEVWRAQDLVLGETVALKFIRGSAARARDPEWAGRLLAEVSAARKVTHGNVCRVHDVGIADDERFISMEFVAGRDLRARLRSSGRLTAEESRRLARETTSALAAIHGAGLLHRDLKPANLLLTEAGSVRLSDFGLAISPATLDGDEARSGTEAYMAPEVLRGAQPSTSSDLYSLGLVLYEAVSNRRGFQSGAEVVRRADRGERPPTPSLLVRGTDPVVDRVVRRCLAPSPGDRPQSAQFLLEVLEREDPLDAVLLLGDEPSADVIAAASAQGLLGTGVARLVLAGFLSLLAALVALVHWTQHGAPLPAASPAAVATRAHAVLERLDGGDWRPASRRSAFGFDDEAAPPDATLGRLQQRGWRLGLREGEDRNHCFWLRESSSQLSPVLWSTVLFGSGRVTFRDPPARVPGLRTVVLGTDERLLSFESTTVDRPAARRSAPHVAAPPEDPLVTCATALRLANVEPAALRSVRPVLGGDGSRSRAAWLATDDANLRIEVEMAGSRLLAFHVLRATGGGAGELGGASAAAGSGIIQFLFYVLLLALALPLAVRHHRSGRGDYVGAARLAVACGVMTSISWYLVADYPGQSLAASLLYPVTGLLLGLGMAAAIWLFYMAVEPSVQREWPRALVGWGRLLRGRFGDPVVRSHVLLGSCAGLLPPLFLVVTRSAAGLPMPSTEDELILAGSSPQLWIAGLIYRPAAVTVVALAFLAAVTFLRLLCRARAAAVSVFVVLASAVVAIDAEHALDVVNAVLVVPLMLWVLLRLGMLAFAAMSFTTTLLVALPIARSSDDWYAGGSAFAIGVLATLALLAGGRRMSAT